MLYRAIPLASIWELFLTGIVSVFHFEGSPDSTCPAGSHVSFWFDEPYYLSGRACLARTTQTPNGQGVMSYKSRDRNRNGELVVEARQVAEYYFDHDIVVEVVLRRDGAEKVTPMNMTTDDLRKEVAEAIGCLDDGYIGFSNIREAVTFITPILPPQREDGEVLFECGDLSGSYNKEELRIFLLDLARFADWWDSLPTVEPSYL